MFNWLSDQFKKSTPVRTLDDVSEDELRREQVRLEQQEKKFAKEIDDLEEQKKKLFADGQRAAGSVHRQRSIAQRIVGVDRQVKLTDRKLRAISKQLQAINNFLYLKQSRRELEGSGLFSIINSMDLEDLDGWIESASIDGELNMKRLEDMLVRVNSSMDLAEPITDDNEISAIMEMFQQGGELDDLETGLTETNQERPLSEL